MKEYVIDARKVESFADFIAAFNLGFCQHFAAEWHGNPNAFNDYLSWPEERYRLKIVGAKTCREVLDAEALGLLGWQMDKAQTLFDALLEMIDDNRDFLELRLE